MNPGRHRIFGFFEFQTDGHRLWYQDAQDVKMPSLWDYAQAHGRRTVSINLPGTYPARPLNGVMISGFMARELASSVYPRLLLPHLEKLGYRLDVDCSQPTANAERFFADAQAALAVRAHTMAAFLEHEPWDLFIGVFTETDRVQHYFFDALLESHHPEFERVRRFYQAVDEALGRCLAKVRDEDEFILLADHGFCRIEQEVFLNTWLAEHGYLTPAERGPDGRRAVFDPARTVAFSLDTGRVFLNVRGLSAGRLPRAGGRAALARRDRRRLGETGNPRTVVRAAVPADRAGLPSQGDLPRTIHGARGRPHSASGRWLRIEEQFPPPGAEWTAQLHWHAHFRPRLALHSRPEMARADPANHRPRTRDPAADGASGTGWTRGARLRKQDPIGANT